MTTAHSVFPIRHHGPGSASALRAALDDLQPDLILVEGPADGTELLKWLEDALLVPPVALVLYRTDKPRRASYFPFARFSPEYQAIRFAQVQQIPVRFMDLPQSTVLAWQEAFTPPDAAALQELAQVAGFPTLELWWNALVEQRQNRQALFPAVLELMTAARQATPEQEHAGFTLNARREAFMRTSIRTACGEGFTRIAVVCGAYHGPALLELDEVEEDVARLAALPHVPVEGAWTPWTYSRLALASGYGSGIRSPGWYDHLWTQTRQQATPNEASIAWLAAVAALLRAEGLDASSAHVIEAARLAESLAALRGLALPGLPELNEATKAVLCFGRREPFDLIRRKLIVGERMGSVPPAAPMTPLQRDLLRQQHELALQPVAEPQNLTLDLRTELDRGRSRLLHRLNLLAVPWAKVVARRNQVGTYQENWRLHWQPELTLRLVEASVWGTTVHAAAEAAVDHRAATAAALPELTTLLDEAILAELPNSMASIVRRVEETAAQRGDILHMMAALPPLAQILRYGSVRQTDRQALRHVVDTLLARICVGLPGICAALSDDAAREVEAHISQVQAVVATFQDEEHRSAWQKTLQTLLDQPLGHGLIGGRACRLLFDARQLDSAAVLRYLERNLSGGRQHDANLGQAAHWLDGFLKGDGLLLLHDQALWDLLDRWITGLDDAEFGTVAPLLRRTFAGFSEYVRQQLDARVRHAAPRMTADALVLADFDHAAAARVLPLLARIVGVQSDE